MANDLRNSNKRSRLEISNELEKKKREPIGVEVNATDTESITSICNELIERILDFLDPQSFLNMAGTCKRLQVAACAMYGRKFGRSHTSLSLKPTGRTSWGCSWPTEGSRFQLKYNSVQVYHRTVLPFLRCFGAHITRLGVHGRDNNSHVARYINQYCADTLTELTIYDYYKEAFTMESFPRPFKMVERVFLLDLDEQFSNFAYWFPRMRALSFLTRRFDFDASSAVFPHLEELSCSALLKSYSEKRRLERFIHSNQQLRYLRIDVEKFRFSSLLDVLSGQTLISNIEINGINVNSKPVKRNLLMRFAREHQEVVELDFVPFLLKANAAIALIRRLNTLKVFKCRLKDQAEYHYFVNRLQHEMDFMFEAGLSTIMMPLTVVRLKINR